MRKNDDNDALLVSLSVGLFTRYLTFKIQSSAYLL